MPRLKGLGLGADKSLALQAKAWKGGKKSGQGSEEDLQMKKGAYCLVTGGKYKDLYGMVSWEYQVELLQVW